LSPPDPLQEFLMRPAWKLAVIGGEVTILAAFTGLGIHLAIQPHHVAFRPPPLTLPTTGPTLTPSPGLPPASPSATSPSPWAGPAPIPDLLRRFGQQDRNLLSEQWTMLQRLTGAIERYVEDRVDEQFKKTR
jgi:hypothetical protein